MQIVNLHEMTNPAFWEKNKKHISVSRLLKKCL